MITCSRMIKYLAIPLILVGCTAPVTDPPAHAQEVDDRDLIMIPRQELKGEIDMYNPNHWHQMQMMFQRNARRTRMEQNATLPSDAINNALDNFWEQQNGSNGSTKSEELL